MISRVTAAPSIVNVRLTRGLLGKALPSGDPKSAWLRGVESSRGVISSRPFGPTRLRAESEPWRGDAYALTVVRVRGVLPTLSAGSFCTAFRGLEICPLAAWIRRGDGAIVGAARAIAWVLPWRWRVLH
jgi:hypothetical protein